jgi:hypothetical protein
MSPASIQSRIEKGAHGERQETRAAGKSRRVVSAVIRRVEATCDEILDWMMRPGGNLQQFSEDVPAPQAVELRVLVDRLRREVHEVQKEVAVDPLVQSRRRSIASAISLTRVELEEVLTPGLRGYGTLSPNLEAALDAKFQRLLSCLSAIGSVLERGHSRGAP